MSRLQRPTGREMIEASTKADSASSASKAITTSCVTMAAEHNCACAGSEIVGVGLLGKILRDCELSRDAFIALYES